MTMTTDEVLAIFREAGAYLEGHFILTSGLRSPVFLQKARVFMHAGPTERLCRAMAEAISARVEGPIDYVVGPAVGGIIPAYETSRHLGVPAIWVERENGVFRLRRFEIPRGAFPSSRSRNMRCRPIRRTPSRRNSRRSNRSSRAAAVSDSPRAGAVSDGPSLVSACRQISGPVSFSDRRPTAS